MNLRRLIPKTLAAVVASALAVAAAVAAVPRGFFQPDELELRFLDVGQGDAVLIRNGRKAALVDAGPSSAIVPHLRALGVDSLDLFIASHNHADHIGGADAVLTAFPVRFYLDNGHPHTTRTQERVYSLIRDLGVTYLSASSRTIAVGDATLRIIPSPFENSDQNNLSVTVLLERAAFTALLTGDSEVPLLNALLATDLVPDVDVLKAAHHGSRNGVTPAWLSRTSPEVVVISVGANNTYGHPDPWALRYYTSGGRTVLRTDLDGDVVFKIARDGAYTVNSEHVGEVTVPVVRERAPEAVRQVPAACCRTCRKGKACGDSCIARHLTCRRPAGCACDG